MSQEEGISLQQAFDMVDEDKDGRITVLELQKLFADSMDQKFGEEDCINWIEQFAPGENGMMNFEQFEKLIEALQNDQPGSEGEQQPVKKHYLILLEPRKPR